jgi:hypothetical protein
VSRKTIRFDGGIIEPFTCVKASRNSCVLPVNVSGKTIRFDGGIIETFTCVQPHVILAFDRFATIRKTISHMYSNATTFYLFDTTSMRFMRLGEVVYKPYLLTF